MPQMWVEPGLVISHNGVSVYNTYRNDNYNDPYTYQFTTDITEQGDPFDIRDLSCFSAEKERDEILKEAILLGEVKAPADDQ